VTLLATVFFPFIEALPEWLLMMGLPVTAFCAHFAFQFVRLYPFNRTGPDTAVAVVSKTLLAQQS
jgi:hypothetical protein